MKKQRDIRLYVDVDIKAGQASPLSDEQVHYLTKVMRCQHGDQVKAFNGRDGEWRMTLEMLSKKKGLLLPEDLLRPQVNSPDLWLLFAPVKKTGTELIIEKGTELGVTRFLPVLTARTQGERFRPDRLNTIMTEAAEQCERLDMPVLEGPQPLDAVLNSWPEARPLWACLEREEGTIPAGMGDSADGAVLIGPEGGFDDAEKSRLQALPFVQSLSLGPRILRAETAVMSALTLWQAHMGDWSTAMKN